MKECICPIMSDGSFTVICKKHACSLYIEEGELLTTEDLKAPGGCAIKMLVMKNKDDKYIV